MSNVLEVTDLKIRHYNKNSHIDAIKNISFSVEEGEFVSICGLNGMGKTSLMLALNGLIPHFYRSKIKGSVIVDGLNTQEHSVSEISRKIGFVFDNPFNQISYTTETVRHEIAFGLCNQNIPKSEMIERIEETAELVGISNLLDRSPLALSGGQLQRIAIASVIVMEPKILMLDDCTSQLDPLGSMKIYDLIEKLSKKGMAILSIDHNLERVCTYSDKILILQDGEIKRFDTPSNILSQENLIDYGVRPHDTFEIGKFLTSNNLIEKDMCLIYKDLEQNILSRQV